MLVVSEPGLLKIILRSQDAIRAGTFAHGFCRWVTHEVLPSIRVHGQYPPPQYALDDPDRAQDRRSTSQDRFIAECKRVASDQGVTVAQLLGGLISRQERIAIETGKGPMDELLTRDKRWASFLGVGMDLHYVLTGVRTITQQERRLIAQKRAMQAEHRLAASVAIHEIEGY